MHLNLVRHVYAKVYFPAKRRLSKETNFDQLELTATTAPTTIAKPSSYLDIVGECGYLICISVF